MHWCLTTISQAASTQRQIKRPRRIDAGRESIVQVERFRFRVFGVDDQRVGGDPFARLQAAINRATDQQLSQALGVPIRAALKE